MQVNFQRDWSYKDGRFRARNNPNQVPDSLKDQLPSDAEILEVSKPKPKSTKSKVKSFLKKDD